MAVIAKGAKIGAKIGGQMCSPGTLEAPHLGSSLILP